MDSWLYLIIVQTVLSDNSCSSSDVFFGVSLPDCPTWRCNGNAGGRVTQALCRCDESCLLFGDCCYDYYTRTLGVHTVDQLRLHLNRHIPKYNIADPVLKRWRDVVESYGSCTFRKNYFKDDRYVIVSKCPNGTDVDLLRKCEEMSDDFLSEVPVSYVVEEAMQVAFRNIYCAKCHEVPTHQVTPWNVSVKKECAPKQSDKTNPKKFKPYESIKSTCILKKEKPYLDPPLRFICSKGIENSNIEIDMKLDNSTYDFICLQYFFATHITVNKTVLTFKNPHCVPLKYRSHESYDLCGGPSLGPTAQIPVPGKGPSVSVAILFNFGNQISIEINQYVYVRNEDLCGSNYIYDTIIENCIEVVCPNSQILGDNGCFYDESSWKFITVPDHSKYVNRTYAIGYLVESSNTSLEDVRSFVEESISGFANISAMVSVNKFVYGNHEEGKEALANTSLSPSTLDNQRVSVVQNDVLQLLTTGVLYKKLNYPPDDTNSVSDKANAKFDDTKFGQNANRTWTNGTDQTERVYFYEVLIELYMNGQINSNLHKILQISSSIANSNITIRNTNYKVDCHRPNLEFANTNNIVYINGSYFGVDNDSRVLFDIDMSEFKMIFSDIEMSFVILRYCKTNYMNCTMGRYNLTEFYFLENGTLVHKSMHKQFDKSDYLIRRNVVLICLNMSAVRTVHVTNLLSSHEMLLSIVIESISVVFLYITGILYCGCFGIKRTNSKSIMFLSFTLGTAQVLFFMPPRSSVVLCQVKAIALHFFWLSSFTWMLIIGFDFAKTFRVDKLQINTVSRRLYLKYTCFGYGVPFMIVLTCVCVDKFVTGQPIGYGKGYCWIGNQNAYRFVFAFPILIIISINILFFIVTVIGMNRAKLNSGDTKSIPNRSFLLIYVKLSLIMGLTWIFGFVAGFLNLTVLWYCHIILNGLQGFDIFLVFVLNRNVCRILRKTMIQNLSSSNRSRNIK